MPHSITEPVASPSFDCSVRVDGWLTTDRLEAQHLAIALRMYVKRLPIDGVTAPPYLARMAEELREFALTGAEPSEPSEPHIRAPEFRGPTLDLSAVAIALGVSEGMASRYCRTGTLLAHKVNRTWQIEPDALEAFRQKRDPK